MNYDTFINVLFSRVEGAVVTRALVVANALIFALLALLCMNPMQIPSDLLIRMGGNFAPLVQKDEPWRLFTALFLHGGLLHVGLNMFALHQAGQVVERLYGRMGFVVLYGVAGLLGNLASLWWKPGPVSVGASGAIFGVYGALLAYLMLQRGSVPNEIFREMRSGTLGFIGYSLFAGFSIPGIDNAAHLGGLVGGLVGGLLCALRLGDAAPCAAVAVAVALQAPFGGKVLQALAQGQQRAVLGWLAGVHIAEHFGQAERARGVHDERCDARHDHGRERGHGHHAEPAHRGRRSQGRAPGRSEIRQDREAALDP